MICNLYEFEGYLLHMGDGGMKKVYYLFPSGSICHEVQLLHTYSATLSARYEGK